MALYTNATSKDTIRNAFYICSQGVNEIFIVCPFFSYDELIEEMLQQGKSIRLVVRLGPATSPKALKKLITHRKVQIRYFTSSYFHSKLYIFGDSVALVGSANCTGSGFQSNREICVEIPREEENFDRLVNDFANKYTFMNGRLQKS